MGQASRVLMTSLAASVLVIAGCGPCKCLDGTRFSNSTSCEECFQGCAGVGSLPAGCRLDETAGTLGPVPDPTFTRVK